MEVWRRCVFSPRAPGPALFPPAGCRAILKGRAGRQGGQIAATWRARGPDAGLDEWAYLSYANLFTARESVSFVVPCRSGFPGGVSEKAEPQPFK